MLLNYCGRLLSGDTPIFTAQSKLVKYGYGIFETILCASSKPLRFEDHYERLDKGMKLLSMDSTIPGDIEQLKANIVTLLHANDKIDAVARVQVFQMDGSLHEAAETGFLISLQEPPLPLKDKYLKSGFYKGVVKSVDSLSNLKHTNYLPYALAAGFAQSQNWDDAIILNQNGRVCDGSIANVFALKKNVIYTPALEEGCVAGVYRKFLLQTLPQIGYEIHEIKMTEAFLLEAEEIFLTNSVRRIQPVEHFENRRLPVSFVKMIIKDLDQAGLQ